MSGSIHRTTKELRRFGLSFGCAFGIIGGLLVWRQREAGPWILGIAVAVALAGLVMPQILRPLERLLAAILRAVMTAVTYVVLVLAFYLIVTPMGLFLRLLGKDLLEMRLPSDKQSFWVPVEADGPCTRPDKPY